MTEYQINVAGGSATNWEGANSPARFALRAAAVVDFVANQPVRLLAHRGWWFPESSFTVGANARNEITGEDAAHAAIARLERGGHGQVEYQDPEGAEAHNVWKDPPDYTFKSTPYLEGVDNIDFVNRWLMHSQVRKGVGTHEDGDMTLKGLVLILYRYRHRLRAEAYNHVLNTLLTQRGPHDPAQLVVFPFFLETENHVLMIESSRYLTNQLLYLQGWETGEDRPEFDNRRNGLTRWLLENLLQKFLQYDFWEFNSKPYQRLTVAALQNLYEFSWEEPIKTAACMVLDYVSAKTAVSSSGLRRAVPFRRVKEYAEETHLFGGHVDAETSRMLMLSGLIEQLDFVDPKWHAAAYSAATMLIAGLGRYRVPELVLDLLMNKRHNAYYQRFFHGNRWNMYSPRPADPPIVVSGQPVPIMGGIEIYANSAGALISAGGAWLPSGNNDFDEFDGYSACANALPTTLMPRWGVNRADFIQILGAPKFKQRINTGVVPGFACGINVWIPAFYRSIPNAQGLIGLGLIESHEGYFEPHGKWTFINASDSSPHPWARFGFHVAVHIDPLWTGHLPPPPVWNFGFFEVASASLRSFADFKQLVLSRNGARTYDHMVSTVFEYETTDGRLIKFRMPVDDKRTWHIVAVNGVPTEIDINTWPLAKGDIMNSRQRPDDPSENGRAGWVSIDNPYFQQRLVLDMRDPYIPRRYQYRRNAKRHTAGALVSRDVFRLDAFWSAPDGGARRIAWDAYVHEGGHWSFPVPLTPPAFVGRRSPLVSVSRLSEHVDLFWLGGDGSIWSCWWSAVANSGEWCRAFKIPLGVAPVVAAGSGLTAVSRYPDHVDLFWIAKNGSVCTHWWNGTVEGGNWGDHQAFAISPPGNASPSSNVAAIARTSGHVDVFWIDAAGSVWTTWWEAKGGWRPPFAISNPGDAAQGTVLSVNSRHPQHVDVFWIGAQGTVRHTWWHPDFNQGRWNAVAAIAPPGSVAGGGLASVSRINEHVDVFWIAPSGAVVSRFWDDRAQPLAWSPAEVVAPAASARTLSPLYAVSRDPGKLDLLWVGPDRQLVTHWWNPEQPGGLWHEHAPFAVAPPNSVRSTQIL